MTTNFCIIEEQELGQGPISVLGFLHPPDGLTVDEAYEQLEMASKEWSRLKAQGEAGDFVAFLVTQYGYRHGDGEYFVHRKSKAADFDSHGDFGGINASEESEMRFHLGRIEADEWANQTQAFIDGHGDLDRAAVKREQLETERVVFHTIRNVMKARDVPGSLTFDDARKLIRTDVAYDVADEIVLIQYAKALKEFYS